MTAWRTPEELVELGFGRSPVVMVNELHSGLRRCVRTREVGRRLLPVAHDCGVRRLAMEALNRDDAERASRERALPPVESGYLAQPELRALVADALALGWTLLAYEDEDARSPFLPGGGIDQALVNEREAGQARSLAAALPGSPLLVWCGNSHLSKHAGGDWTPMGLLFRELTGIDHFALDQAATAGCDPVFVEPLRAELEARGGTAGTLLEDAPEPFCGRPGVDALVLSLDNELV